MTQVISSAENMVLIVLLAWRWRSLLSVRKHLRSPYIAMCLVYSIMFIYIFASLGNVGLLVRERTLLFPMLFVLLSLPRQAPKPLARRRDRSTRAVSPGTDDIAQVR